MMDNGEEKDRQDNGGEGATPPAGSGSSATESELSLDLICTTGRTQVREELNARAVKDYAKAMKEGATFPSIVVYFDGTTYWLADGFHRVMAAREAGRATISAEVRTGGEREAFLHATGANSRHGIRLTRKDIRRLVTLVLENPEWCPWSNEEIVRQCGNVFSEGLVRIVRKELFGSSGGPKERMVRRGDSVYPMNTEKIERARKPPEASGPLPVSPAGVPDTEVGQYRTLVLAPTWSPERVASIRALPVAGLAAPDAAVWLWSPNRFVPEALRCLEAWGLRYRTMVTWRKGKEVSRRPEDWLAETSEQCILATRGEPAVTPSDQGTTLYVPDVADLQRLSGFWGLVESICPEPRAALFLQSPRGGWSSFVESDGRLCLVEPQGDAA
jgi:N6-adenosine-specific RNA methylase IME4